MRLQDVVFKLPCRATPPLSSFVVVPGRSYQFQCLFLDGLHQQSTLDDSDSLGPCFNRAGMGRRRRYTFQLST